MTEIFLRLQLLKEYLESCIDHDATWNDPSEINVRFLYGKATKTGVILYRVRSFEDYCFYKELLSIWIK